MNVSAIILEQLGGNGRLSAMIGAHNYTTSGNDLTFHFKGSRKMNCLKVELNSSDLYDLTFYKLGKVNVKIVKEMAGVFAEDMKTLIECETGLYLSL